MPVGGYDGAFCGGLQAKSGKGGGARSGAGQRHQIVWVYPTWISAKNGEKADGSDVFFSSRWDGEWQIFDHYYTPKTVGEWRTTKTYEWVFIREVPYHKAYNKVYFEFCLKHSWTPQKLKDKFFFLAEGPGGEEAEEASLRG